MRQALAGGQRVTGARQLGREIRGGNSNAGAGVGDVVRQLLRLVHGVDGHHHGIGPQNGKVRNDQLRAVLHVEHHAVPLFHAQVLQVGRQSFGFVHQLGIAEHPPKENEGRFVGVTPGAGFQVVPQGRLGQGDGQWQPLRPKAVVRALDHGAGWGRQAGNGVHGVFFLQGGRKPGLHLLHAKDKRARTHHKVALSPPRRTTNPDLWSNPRQALKRPPAYLSGTNNACNGCRA